MYKTKILAVALLSVAGGLLNAANAAERWVLRTGVAHVSPQDSSGDVAAFPGNGVSVDDATGFGISLSYLLTPNVALEVLGAMPFSHKVHAQGPDLGGLGQIARVRQLPPTLLLNYSMPIGEHFRPYVGGGLNHTFFFKEKASESLQAALGASEVKLDSSTSYALQAGFDWKVNETSFFNVALWYIDIDTKATVNFAGGPASGDAAGSTHVNVEIDPVVLMIGFGQRF